MECMNSLYLQHYIKSKRIINSFLLSKGMMRHDTHGPHGVHNLRMVKAHSNIYEQVYNTKYPVSLQYSTEHL